MEQSPIDKLINDISKLPGLGRRSAQRIALFLLKNLFPFSIVVFSGEKKYGTLDAEQANSLS